MADYREYLISLSLSSRTIRGYELVIARAGRWADENGADLLDLTPSQARALGDSWPLTHPSRRPVRVALRYYWTLHGVPGQETSIIVPKRPRSRWKGLVDDDVEQLLAHARLDWPKGGAVYLGVYQGLRRQNIASLRWNDFDVDMAWVTFMGKGGRERSMPVHPKVRRVLAPHREPGGHLFPGRFGGHVSSTTINNWIHSITVEAGVGHVTPHQMRHTSGGKVFRETGNIYLAAAWLGHADISTTQVYTEVEETMLYQALDAHDWGSVA